ncbi:uncharacterized protein EI97DRAFT_39594 [Westerdykella ornata]|uniref:Uncharacterized protein n=1 Tax=Westerdykella ornata TaxID=318751 RepID=A0A6A6JJK8_WESOR|nr:uncharacterized protein EI97DRAFT_39594 [Westerdykella ornata]KAF2276425.1 hypothetical protein EI97DRAFT_39594 [Westerdykella ornata]
MAATGIVYLAIHIWNLILVFSGFELGWSCVYYDIEGNFLRFAVHIVQVPRWIFWIFALPIYYFPLVLFRTIVHRDVQALLRYPPRLALKIYQRLAQRAEAQKRPANAATELLDLTPLPNTPKPPLASLLSTYDILLLIAANLHYSDFRNLTLASRHVRHAALHRLPPDHYIRYTCHPDERTGRIRCFLCDIPCCTSCCTFTPIRQSPLPFHLESCRPYCHGCYITHIHRDPHTYDGNELMATTCECHPEPSRLQWLWDYLYRAEYLETENTQERRHVCRQCNTLNDRELTKKWDRRAMWELMHPEAREGMNSCVMCKKDVRGALRWWVCGECGLECTSGVHLA